MEAGIEGDDLEDLYKSVRVQHCYGLLIDSLFRICHGFALWLYCSCRASWSSCAMYRAYWCSCQSACASFDHVTP